MRGRDLHASLALILLDALRLLGGKTLGPDRPTGRGTSGSWDNAVAPTFRSEAMSVLLPAPATSIFAPRPPSIGPRSLLMHPNMAILTRTARQTLPHGAAPEELEPGECLTDVLDSR